MTQAQPLGALHPLAKDIGSETGMPPCEIIRIYIYIYMCVSLLSIPANIWSMTLVPDPEFLNPLELPG